MSGIIPYKHTFHYVSTSQKLPQFLPEIFLGSVCQTLILLLNLTINDGNTVLAQYPAAKV